MCVCFPRSDTWVHEITELAVDYPKLSVHRRWLAIPFGWLCKLFAQTLIQGVNERHDTWWAILVYVGFSFSLTLGVHKRFELFASSSLRESFPIAGVKLVSVTQELGDDPMSNMIRQIMALFDEYQSKENAKHTLRAMKENARQGFWNGSLPPIGYRIVEAGEQHGNRTKKTLEIDPIQAETVRLIFRLAREGDGTSGPMGVKSITRHLNAAGIRTRDGGRWGIGAVHKVLTRTAYVGRHRFNTRFWKTRERKPESEVVEMAVPPIIEPTEFAAVQALLKTRSPALTAPRIVSGPTLLTGICFCAACGRAMTLRTGKSGQYRYYTCSTKARQGETGCKGRTVPMDKLDTLVADHIEQRLLQPKRLERILSTVLDRREERAERRATHIAQLGKRVTETEAKLKRLYDAIENGVAEAASFFWLFTYGFTNRGGISRTSCPSATSSRAQ